MNSSIRLKSVFYFAMLLLSISLIQGCVPHYYKLKNHKIKKKRLDLVIEDHLPTNYVFLHMGDNYWLLNEFQVDRDTLIGSLEKSSDEAYALYNKSKAKRKLKIKKNTIEETYANQLHLFTDEIEIDGDKIKISTDKLTGLQSLSEKKAKRIIIYTSIALPTSFIIFFLLTFAITVG